MATEWEMFLTDARLGNVGGTFEFFDTEAQITMIRDADDALDCAYNTVDFGQWATDDFANDTGLDLGVAKFGLSQFVPRHNYNGEIWAVGITPVEVPTQEGWFPKARTPVGFALYHHCYKELMPETLKL